MPFLLTFTSTIPVSSSPLNSLFPFLLLSLRLPIPHRQLNTSRKMPSPANNDNSMELPIKKEPVRVKDKNNKDKKVSYQPHPPRPAHPHITPLLKRYIKQNESRPSPSTRNDLAGESRPPSILKMRNPPGQTKPNHPRKGLTTVLSMVLSVPASRLRRNILSTMFLEMSKKFPRQP